MMNSDHRRPAKRSYQRFKCRRPRLLFGLLHAPVSGLGAIIKVLVKMPVLVALTRATAGGSLAVRRSKIGLSARFGLDSARGDQLLQILGLADRTACRRRQSENQMLEFMAARLAAIFVDRHESIIRRSIEYGTRRNEALDLRATPARGVPGEHLCAEPGQSSDAVLGGSMEPATGLATRHHTSDYANHRRISLGGHGRGVGSFRRL